MLATIAVTCCYLQVNSKNLPLFLNYRKQWLEI